MKHKIFNTIDSGQIDSFCFVCTYKHRDKAKAQDRGLGIKGYKIGGIKIVAYSNSTLFDSN